MARKGIALLVAMAMIGMNLGPLAAPARADDDWRTKAYTEWGQEDVQKLLSDSPWVKRVRLPVTWRRSSGANPDATTDRSGGQSTSPDEFPSRGRARMGMDELSDQARANQAEFRIRWNSSRPLRRALVRAAVLQGRQMTAEAERYVATEPEEFEVMILGQDMAPFRGISEEALKEKTYIRPKKGKEKYAPLRVNLIRQGEQNRLVAVAFFFAKKSASGEAIVATDEKGIEFRCQIGPVVLQSNFETQKMTDQHGLAL